MWQIWLVLSESRTCAIAARAGASGDRAVSVEMQDLPKASWAGCHRPSFRLHFPEAGAEPMSNRTELRPWSQHASEWIRQFRGSRPAGRGRGTLSPRDPVVQGGDLVPTLRATSRWEVVQQGLTPVLLLARVLMPEWGWPDL